MSVQRIHDWMSLAGHRPELKQGQHSITEWSITGRIGEAPGTVYTVVTDTKVGLASVSMGTQFSPEHQHVVERLPPELFERAARPIMRSVWAMGLIVFAWVRPQELGDGHPTHWVLSENLVHDGLTRQRFHDAVQRVMSANTLVSEAVNEAFGSEARTGVLR